ncbi:DUF2332 domain-containing protein [Granulicoccus phenolivorans]|uniref:DUF2332 domain-containing protein n=1 Tax=Granulicoccus phenolivorans TaxID=266854 RepID=UPI0004265D59|nr:DUF2332 domain-containing protein [Granulicoccus phenolivorans]
MPGHYFAAAPVAALYRRFAEEARSSPTWQGVSSWIAETDPVLELLDTLPGMKRQPNLFLAALRYFEAPLQPGPDLSGWIAEHWTPVRELILQRETQTNEAGRCAVLAPVLAALPGPLALIEVGSSAGLCLLPDRYGYRWSDRAGRTVAELPGEPVLECVVSGSGPAYARPEVAWRLGVDRNPLDPADPADARWLESLVWPDQDERQRRLHAALAIAAAQPPPRIRGEALEMLPTAVAQVPAGLTPVVLHSFTAMYLPREDRDRLCDLIESLPVHWVSLEGERAIGRIADRVPADGWSGPPGTLLALDGHPLARAGWHGERVHWLAP